MLLKEAFELPLKVLAFSSFVHIKCKNKCEKRRLIKLFDNEGDKFF